MLYHPGGLLSSNICVSDTHHVCLFVSGSGRPVVGVRCLAPQVLCVHFPLLLPVSLCAREPHLSDVSWCLCLLYTHMLVPVGIPVAVCLV